jgi:hypothetical protein
MAARLALVVGLLLLGAPAALAAKPLTEAQADAVALKASMVKKFKSTPALRGVTIGKVVCVLPKNGVVFHCTVDSNAPASRENLIFGVAVTLHDNDATSVTWRVTSQACSDSKTHAKIAC